MVSLPKIDLTITISVIVALCAIVSPVLTAIINNRHQYKMRELELRYVQEDENRKRIQRIYDDYLSAAGAVIRLKSHDNRTQFGASANLAYCYAPEAAREKMRSFEWLLLVGENEKEKIDLLNEIALTLEPKPTKQSKAKRRK